MTDKKLLFVYNAGSNLFSSVADMAHKIFSPSTYQCYLCALTYGDFRVKKDWKSFIDSLPVESVFIYKDQFVKQYKLSSALPAVFMQSESGLEEIISTTELENCADLEELKKLVSTKISNGK